MFDSEDLRRRAEESTGTVEVGNWELLSLLDTLARYQDALEEVRANDRASLQTSGYRKQSFGWIADTALYPQTIYPPNN